MIHWAWLIPTAIIAALASGWFNYWTGRFIELEKQKAAILGTDLLRLSEADIVALKQYYLAIKD